MTARRVPTVLFVNWQAKSSRRRFPVGRLVTLPDGGYEFAYIAAAREAEQVGFSPFVAFPEFERVYRSPELPSFFKNRVLQPGRPDYPQHLQELGLESATATPIEILARSGGRRVTDPLEVFAELVPSASEYRLETHFFARGIRHFAGAEDAVTHLHPGDLLTLKPEPGNAVNTKALLLACSDQRCVGYVPDYLAEDLNGFAASDPSMLVEVVRVNPAPSPSQQRLLCRLSISSSAPRPHRGARFEPIAPNAVRLRVSEIRVTGALGLGRGDPTSHE